MGREVDADHMGNKNSMIKWEKERKEQGGKQQVPAALVGLVLISSATDFNCIYIKPVLNQQINYGQCSKQPKKQHHTAAKNFS
jgi:hypothetical protein